MVNAPWLSWWFFWLICMIKGTNIEMIIILTVQFNRLKSLDIPVLLESKGANISFLIG